MNEPLSTRPYVLLHVADLDANADLFIELIGREPVERSPTFALFGVDGLMLGLWKRDGVEPAASGATGGSEVAFDLGTDAMVERTFERWQATAVTVLQAPVRLDFGLSFTVATPEGHRLRVFALDVDN